MRKITPESSVHNAAPRPTTGLFLAVLVLVIALGVSACSGDKGSEKDKTAADRPATPDCRIKTDTTAWTAFIEIADRVAAEEGVTHAEFEAYGDLPAVTLWRQSLKPGTPSSQKVGNWLEGTFWEELGRTGTQKANTDRTRFIRRFRYCVDKKEVIGLRLDELTGPRICELMDLAEFWIEPANLPDNLNLYFLPAKPEIRISDNSLLVDVGAVAAGSTDQVIRQMGSLLYRNFQFETGESPGDLQGEPAIAHSFRVLMNEGITGWIEKAVYMEFDTDHPELYKVKIVPEEFFFKAQQAIGMMNRQLGSILDDEADLAEKGNSFVMHLAGMNAFSQTGYAMAAVISHRLGDERLRDSGRSVPAFLAAFQEAAEMNPDPVPTPGLLGVELYETVPPLNPDLFTRLHALLETNFPE